MKVNNLFKKVGSVITTAALLGTLGITAFADETTATGGISITSVNAVQKGSSDVYDVTVNYKTTKANTVGMTLLVYKNSDNKTDLTTGSYNGESMQIIGINQDAAVSGSSDSATEGHFTFSVTTNSTDANNYYLQKGTKALIAVSGDQCTPDYATLMIEKDPVVVDSEAKLSLGDVSIPADKTIADELTEKAQEDGTGPMLTSGGTDTGVKLPLKDITLTWTPPESGSGEGTWTGRVTLTPAQFNDLKIGGVKANGNVTVTVTANVTRTAVPADKVSSVVELTAVQGNNNTFTKTYTADKGTDETAIKTALFNNKTATISKDNVTGTVTLSGDWAVLKDTTYDKDKDENQDLVYEVTIPQVATVTGITYPDNNYLTIPAAGLKFTVNVTVSRTQYIGAITIEGAPTSIEVSSTATDKEIKDSLNEAIKNATIKIDGTAADTTKITMDWVITKTDEGVPTSAKLHVSAVDSSLGNLPAEGIDVEPSIGITVKQGSKYALGDLNGDGVINALDAGEVMKKFFNSSYEFKDKSGDVIDDINAKLNMDNVINALDAGEVMKKFFDSSYKFPVEE